MLGTPSSATSPSATKPNLVSTPPSAAADVSITSAPVPLVNDTPTPPGVNDPEAASTPIFVVVIVLPSSNSVIATTFRDPDTAPRPDTSMEPWFMVSSRRSTPFSNTSWASAVDRPVFTV